MCFVYNGESLYLEAAAPSVALFCKVGAAVESSTRQVVGAANSNDVIYILFIFPFGLYLGQKISSPPPFVVLVTKRIKNGRRCTSTCFRF